MDRCTGLLASSATRDTDRLALAFKPGTAPSAFSTGEAVAAARAARERARTQPVDIRPWGGE